MLVDDHAIVRQGLRSLLENKARVDVVGEAKDGRMAISMVEKLQPDLVIMDIAMPGLNGLEALQQMVAATPGIKVIILSMHIEKTYVTRALRYGACGYVYKGSAFDDLELAMKAALNNETFLSPKVSSIFVNGFLQSSGKSKNDELIDLLTSREREIMQLFAEGKNRVHVANILSISVKTVDRHKGNLKEKLKLKNEEEITSMAKELGLTGL